MLLPIGPHLAVAERTRRQACSGEAMERACVSFALPREGEPRRGSGDLLGKSAVRNARRGTSGCLERPEGQELPRLELSKIVANPSVAGCSRKNGTEGLLVNDGRKHLKWQGKLVEQEGLEPVADRRNKRIS